MKNFKKLLANQRGLSLVEVLIAASMAVATSMVVMQVTENANKSTKKLESDTEMMDLERYLITSLTSGENCFLTMNPPGFDMVDPAGELTDTVNHPHKYGPDDLGYTTPASLDLVVRSTPGTPPTADVTETFTAGQPVPKHPLWTLDEIRIYEITDTNGSNEGICQIYFGLNRNVGNNGKRMSGIVGKGVQVALNCTIDTADNDKVIGCASMNGLANSYWLPLNNANPADGIYFGSQMQNRVHAKGHLIVGNTPVLGNMASHHPVDGVDSSLDVHGKSVFHDTLKLFDLSSSDSPILSFQNDNGTIQYNSALARMVYTAQSRFTSNLEVGTPGGTTADAFITRNLRVGGYVQIDSDERLKKDKLVIENASDKLDEISGYTYVLKRTGDEHIGFMAQELQKIFPQAVHQGSDGYLSVSYHMLIPVLVEAHKEQKAIIKDQQAEIEKLREDVKFLYDEVQKIKRRQEPNHWPLIYP